MLRSLTAVSLLARGGARIARPLPCAALPLRSLLSTGTGGSPPRKPPADGRMADFLPQHLSNTSWAFAKAGHKAPALFDAIRTEAKRRGKRLSRRDVGALKSAFELAGLQF